MLVQQPSNQIKLTNVSIVRLKKGGKRFEIACYKNKVQEWRNGVETDLDDVLQISNVFINVSKGEVAKSDDLQKAFGKTDVGEIVKEILKKGELQVGEKERAHELASLWKEIAAAIAAQCVDPATQRPYSSGIIEKAMTEAGFSVKTGKSAKSQVVECIKLIQAESKLPLQRARMRIRVVLAPLPAPAESAAEVAPVQSQEHEEEEMPRRGKARQPPPGADDIDSDSDDGRPRKGKRGKAKGKAKAKDAEPKPAPKEKAAKKDKAPAATLSDEELRKRIIECADQIERQSEQPSDPSKEWEAVMLIDPAEFRVINDLLHKESQGRGRVETLTLAGAGAM